jgi:hypothetical protein
MNLLVNFLNNLNEYRKKEWVKNILFILRAFSTIALLITSLSLIILSVGYSFLYGYYFSGDVSSATSIMELITVIVPFNKYSIIVICTFTGLSVLFIYSFIHVIKTKNILLIIVSVIFFGVFQYLLTTIFTGEVSLENLLYMLSMWILPVIFSSIIYFLFLFSTNFLSCFSGAALGIVVYYHLNKFIDLNSELEYLLLLFLMPFTGITIAYLYKKHKVLQRFIFIPIFLCLLYLANSSLLKIGEKRLIIAQLLIIILGLSISYLVPEKWFNPFTNHIKNENSCSEEKKGLEKIVHYFEQNNKHTLLNTFSILILSILVIIPSSSLISGKYISSFVPNEAIKKEKILFYNNQYEDYSAKAPVESTTEGITGIIIAIKDDIIYVSNENRKLERIKTQTFRTIIE